MPDRVDVSLVILMLAVLAIVGRLLLGVLVWCEDLLFALRIYRVMSVRPDRSISMCSSHA